jgi:bacteriorhodopsin
VITAQMSSTDVVSDEVLSPELKQAVIEEQLQFASDISIFFAAVFFMFLAFYIIFSMNDISMRVVKRSSLKMRLDYCVTVNLYICFFSCLFNTIQLADWDDVEIPDVNSTLDLARPIEWILTCPLMQICLVVVGGEKVKESRAVWAPLCSAIILCWGTASALAPWQAMKLLCYIVGAGFFLILCSLMNETIRESTNGMESLCSGQSNVRALTMLVVLTWIPFPIWYALSPEGFNIIQNAPLMRIAVSFLNIISKGTFTLFLLRLRANEKLTLSLKAEGQVDKSGNTHDKLSRDSYSGRLVAETLRSIGRMDETEAIMKLLDSHMVTTLGDILVLTPEYCEQIGLPWTFVYAFKELPPLPGEQRGRLGLEARGQPGAGVQRRAELPDGAVQLQRVAGRAAHRPEPGEAGEGARRAHEHDRGPHRGLQHERHGADSGFRDRPGERLR